MLKLLFLGSIIVLSVVLLSPVAYQTYIEWDAQNPADDESSINKVLNLFTPRITLFDVQQSNDYNLGIPIVDIRSKEDYDAAHVVNAVWIKEDEIKEKAEKILPEKNIKIYVYGYNSYDAAVAARLLTSMGYVAYAFEKGFDGWVKGGYKTTKTNYMYF